MDLFWLLALVMSIETGLHYFPWKILLKGKELPRVAAYILGVLGMMVPFSVWLIEQGEHQVLRMLWAVIGAGGLIVMALYGLDRYLDLELRDIESHEREIRAKK